MKLKNEFLDFYDLIKIDKESEVLTEKREVLQNDIKKNLPGILEDHGIDIYKSDIRMVDQGSYKLKTTIKSKITDRDVAVMIPIDTDENSDSRKIKNYLKEAISIPSRTIEVKEPCVRVSYIEDGEEWLHIDLPLYSNYGDNVFLARGKLYSNSYSWDIADPDGLNDYLTERIIGHDQLRRIICFIKKWRDEEYSNSTNDHEVPSSIGLTLLVCENYISQTENEEDNDLLSLQNTMNNIKNKFTFKYDENGNIMAADVKCYLPVVPYTDVFEKMKSSSEDYMVKFYKRLIKAVDNLTDAVNVESDHDAAECVQKVLGEDFPKPEKDAKEVDTLSKREHSFG